MFSNSFSDNNQKRNKILETVNQILTGNNIKLNEAPDDAPGAFDNWRDYYDYAKAKSSFIDDYDMRHKLRSAADEVERQSKYHLPKIKAEYDAELTVHPHTIEGEFSFPDFSEETARNAVVNNHVKATGKEPDEKHVRSEVTRLKTRHKSDMADAFKKHTSVKQRHEARFDSWLTDFVNTPSRANHPLVRAVKQQQEMERAATLATETLPRFSGRNIARAAGDFIHGSATGRATEYSSYARQRGAEHHQFRTSSRKSRPIFDVGVAAPAEKSEHAPR